MEKKIDSQAIQIHLGILQSTIQRMATNSSSAKTSCITLVSAILVIIADKSKPQYTWIAIIPIILFLVIDAYYLGLERGFRNSWNEFIAKFHEEKLFIHDLYVVMPKGGQRKLFFDSIRSFSVWPFYFALSVMIFIARYFII